MAYLSRPGYNFNLLRY